VSELFDLKDTIIALSTSIGHGALAVIRLSGDRSYSFVLELVRNQRGKRLKLLSPRLATFGLLIDPQTSETVDEVVITYFKGPKSYTGEDIIEISCHGNMLLAQKIIALFQNLGARLARPGEFTERAYHNKKLDLIQAESVADLIHASSEKALRFAKRNVQKLLSQRIKSVSDTIKHYLVFYEAYIDFPEDEIPSEHTLEIEKEISVVMDVLINMIDSYKEGVIVREGAKVVILGPPNVGKSSLLNLLLGENRALISDIPGTTRDIIREGAIINDIAITLVDTAGLRDTREYVESEGVEFSLNQAELADIVLFVEDVNSKNKEEFNSFFTSNVLELIKNKPIIKIYNKCDLAFNNIDEIPDKFKQVIENDSGINVEKPRSDCGARLVDLLKYSTGCGISVKNYWNIDKLKNLIYQQLLGEKSNQRDLIITNERHFKKLKECFSCLQEFKKAHKNNAYYEVLAFELKQALSYLHEITGEVTSEDILNSIFSNFCIGK